MCERCNGAHECKRWPCASAPWRTGPCEGRGLGKGSAKRSERDQSSEPLGKPVRAWRMGLYGVQSLQCLHSLPTNPTSPYSTQIITSCAPLMHHMPGTLAPCRDRAIIHPAHSKLRPRFCTLHAAAVLSVLHPQVSSCLEKQYEVGKVRFQHASEDASVLSACASISMTPTTT